MKKLQLLLLLFSSILLYSISAFSQESSIYGSQTAKNSVSVNLGFNPGEFYIPLTVNYEHLFYDAGFAKINGRIGIGFWLYWTDNGLEFPFSGQIVFFKKNSHLEIGMGGNYIYDFDDNMTDLSHLLNIAYRFQKPDGKFLFKIGIEKNKWVIYPYISTGYAF